MIVVDTSVWIDLLRGRSTRRSDLCAALIAEGAPVAISHVILTELLQGVAADGEAETLFDHLTRFPILGLEGVEGDALAASLYRAARASGHTVASTIDCLIAATCISHGASLLHDDRDFDRLAACTPLRVYQGGA